MSASQNYRDLPVPVEDPSSDGHHDLHGVTPPAPVERGKVPRTRIGELWVTAVAFALVLLVLLIFVLENGQRAEVSFFGAHGHLPMGVALLLAAVFGVLLVALPGTARIVQLRHLDRRRSRDTTLPPVDNARTPQTQDTENQSR